MKKTVLKLDIRDGKEKRKAMKLVSTLSGIDSIAIDMKEQKLTVIGSIDPVTVVMRLRKKQWQVELLTVGPAKEEKKDNPNKKVEDKKKADEQMAQLLKAYQEHNPYPVTRYYHNLAGDDSDCVIM